MNKLTEQLYTLKQLFNNSDNKDAFINEIENFYKNIMFQKDYIPKIINKLNHIIILPCQKEELADVYKTLEIHNYNNTYDVTYKFHYKNHDYYLRLFKDNNNYIITIDSTKFILDPIKLYYSINDNININNYDDFCYLDKTNIKYFYVKPNNPFDLFSFKYIDSKLFLACFIEIYINDVTNYFF